MPHGVILKDRDQQQKTLKGITLVDWWHTLQLPWCLEFEPQWGTALVQDSFCNDTRMSATLRNLYRTGKATTLDRERWGREDQCGEMLNINEVMIQSGPLNKCQG